MLATTEVNVQDIQMLGLHLEWEIEILILRFASRTENQTFLAVQEKRKHRVLVPKRSLQGEPCPQCRLQAED